MKNYISINISYLMRKINTTQDLFGLLFDLKKGVINQYLLEKSTPKLETIDKICAYFEITIDQFIKTDLSKGFEKSKSNQENETTLRLRKAIETIEKDEKYIATLEENNALKAEKIQLLEEKLKNCEQQKKLLGGTKHVM